MGSTANWRELPAGRDLDRVILETITYTVVREMNRDVEWGEIYLFGKEFITAVHGVEELTDEQIITKVFERYESEIPFWSEDAQAMSTLWSEEHHPDMHSPLFHPMVDKEPHYWRGELGDGGMGLRTVETFMGTLADVGARCWLAAKEREKEQQN